MYQFIVILQTETGKLLFSWFRLCAYTLQTISYQALFSLLVFMNPWQCYAHLADLDPFKIEIILVTYGKLNMVDLHDYLKD